MPEPVADEDDMLDIAACLTDTSRLGCQVFLTPDVGDFRATMPEEVTNYFEED
jgi:ferredoxin